MPPMTRTQDESSLTDVHSMLYMGSLKTVSDCGNQNPMLTLCWDIEISLLQSYPESLFPVGSVNKHMKVALLT